MLPVHPGDLGLREGLEVDIPVALIGRWNSCGALTSRVRTSWWLTLPATAVEDDFLSLDGIIPVTLASESFHLHGYIPVVTSNRSPLSN